jgi:hypothetical protein
MEVYHRLRIFENQDVNTDIEFPYISSSLDIGLPDDGFEASLKYAIADSTYDKDTTKFHTEWSGLKATGVSQCLRLYLCGSASAVNATTDKTPHILVSNSKTGTAYNSGTKPYKVASEYYLSFCGLTPEYLDLTNSTILPTSLGYTHDVKVTDHMLMAGLCTVVYGPYVRSLRYMNTYEVSGKNINGPAINLYHVGMSHWIDVSKLVACDPSKFHIITSEDDKNALAFDSFPNEFIRIEPDSSSADTSANEKDESADDFWIDKRCNASVIDPNGSIYFRPEVSTTRCPEGYRVYLSCIFDNTGKGLSQQANTEYYNLVAGTRWDWINVQIWENNTYLTADCFVSYYRGGSVNIEFENVHYYTGTTEVEDEDAILTKAKETIFAVSNTGHRIDIYAVTNDDNTIICTTELASSMAYDNSWGEDNAYVKSFDPSGSRATGRQTYNGSPLDITLQYKLYASTEVPIRDRIKYQLYGKVIQDEFHILTSNAAFDNMYHKQKYYDGDNDPYIRHIPVEMYTGLKWDNIEYYPHPIIEPMYLPVVSSAIAYNSMYLTKVNSDEPSVYDDNNKCYCIHEGDDVPAVVWDVDEASIGESTGGCFLVLAEDPDSPGTEWIDLYKKYPMFPENDILEKATSDITVAYIRVSYNYSKPYYWHFHTNASWQSANMGNGTCLYLGNGVIDETGKDYNIVDIFDEVGNKIPNLPVDKWYELRIYHDNKNIYFSGEQTYYRSKMYAVPAQSVQSTHIPQLSRITSGSGVKYTASLKVYSDSTLSSFEELTYEFTQSQISTYFDIDGNSLKAKPGVEYKNKFFVKPTSWTSSSKFVLARNKAQYDKGKDVAIPDTENGIDILQYANIDLFQY